MPRVCHKKGGAQAPCPPLPPLQAPPLGAGGGALLPGAVEQQQPQFISRFLEGQSGVTIKHVACGDLFTACLTGSWSSQTTPTPCRGDPCYQKAPQSTFPLCLSFTNCSINNASIY